jgi:hypothetical protein
MHKLKDIDKGEGVILPVVLNVIPDVYFMDEAWCEWMLIARLTKLRVLKIPVYSIALIKSWCMVSNLSPLLQ